MIRLSCKAALLLLLIALAGCGGGDSSPSSDPPPPVLGSKTLPIPPKLQQTPVWCWAATAQMVFEYYGLRNVGFNGDYQCGIVAAYFQGFCLSSCYACVTPIGGMADMQTLIQGYGQFLTLNGIPSRVLTSTIRFGPLSMQEVAAEIEANRPVIAGISPTNYAFPNFSQHVVLVIGYETNGSVPPRLIVNDPFPYALFGQPNPILVNNGFQIRPGQYSVPYSSFVFPINWDNSLHVVQ